MANSDHMPDAPRAPSSTSEEPTSESPSEPFQPLPAGHPGIGFLIMRARRRRSRETAELLAGVDMHRRSSGPRPPAGGDDKDRKA